MPTVSIKRNDNDDLTFEVPENLVLFDALDDLGHELPHGCLAGSCGACRLIILKGKENLSPPSMIEENTLDSIRVNYQRIHGADFLKDKEIRLSCRAKVLGDIEIEILH